MLDRTATLAVAPVGYFVTLWVFNIESILENIFIPPLGEDEIKADERSALNVFKYTFSVL